MWIKRLLPLRTNQYGETLVEVLVAIALAGILIPVLATALATASAARPMAEKQLQATSLLREATAALGVVEENGWAGLSNGTYHPVVSGSTWALVAGPEVINGFTRQMVVANAQRDASGNVVESGGISDPATRKITTIVSWTQPYSGSVEVTNYLTHWRGGATVARTTQAEFNAGLLVNTVTTATGGGDVQLAQQTTQSWASPLLAGALNGSGTTDGFDVYVDAATSRAYLAQGTTLNIVNISNPASPALLGSYAVGSNVNGVYVSGNYAYLATASNTAELTVVDVTTPASPTLADTLNLGGTADGFSVFVSGTYAYVGKGVSTTAGDNELYIVNVATPTNITLSGSLNVTANVNSVYVSGNYAYLATAVTTAELTIANITNKAAPSAAGVYDASGTSVGNDVFAIGTTVYLGKANNTTGAEFFIINAATPASPTLVGSYEAAANINGVYIVGTEAFLATAITGAQFRVLNIATPATPTLLGSYNHGSTTNDIMVVNNMAYLASTSNTQELLIVQRGLVGSGYLTSGTYESATITLASEAAFNYLSYTTTAPAGTTIGLQIATNSDNATWNYIGPDGTAATYYSANGAIPYAAAAGRYVRIKAYLTSAGATTPSLLDFTVGYTL